jgi:hypothetical protein
LEVKRNPGPLGIWPPSPLDIAAFRPENTPDQAPKDDPKGVETGRSVFLSVRPVEALLGLAGEGETPREGALMLQRIGWLRPSPDERRLWLIQGAVILASVLAIGTVVFLALR